MTRNDIIRMAREAGLPAFLYPELIVETDWKLIERFAALVASAERDAISDEWWMCVQSDLENGVKSLNEAATEKWQKEYPEISKFAAWLEARGNQ